MTIPPEHVTGVLLAAGRSRRMGVPKLVLAWPPGGASTVIAAAFDAIAPFCGRIIVVVGDDPASVACALAGRPHQSVAGAPDCDMLASAQCGLAAALAARGDPAHWIMLQPADHPLVEASTIARLLEYASSSARSTMAVMPEHDGRGGHPVVIAARAVSDILAWRGEGGLAGHWRSRAAEVLRIPVDDSGVVLDLDTPEAYGRFA